MNRVPALLKSNLVQKVPVRTKAFLGPVRGTFNDLPQPSGCWKTHYEANQRKYNAHLVLGAVMLTATILFGKVSGLIYLNAYPPAEPAPKNDYKK